MRRVVLSLGVLGVAAGIARVPFDPHTSVGRYAADARESRAFVLTSAPVRFEIPAGRDRVRILTNLDLPADVPAEGIDYGVRVRFPGTSRDETYGLRAKPVEPDGDIPRVFYMGDGAIPAATREIALSLSGDDTASMEISLVWPGQPQGPGTASLRVMLAEKRPPLAGGFLEKRLGDEGRERLAAALGPLAWSELGESTRDQALTRRWVQVGAAALHPSRRLYSLDRPAPQQPASRAKGEPVGPGKLLAYTVRGPGTLRLLALDGTASGTVETMDEAGRLRTSPLALQAGQDLSIPVESKLLTVRIASAVAGRVQAAVSSTAMSLLPSPAREHAPTNDEPLSPPSMYENGAIARPEHPVRFDLRGRRTAELRLVARAVTRGPGEKPAAAVRWSVLDGAHRIAATAELRLPEAPAREDRVEGEEATTLGEPAAVFVWPPKTGEQLEICADGQAVVTVSSPGFEVDLTAQRDPDLAPELHLRHQTPDTKAWFPVRPANADELGEAGRLLRLRLPIRLERLPASPPPPILAESVEPAGRQARFDLLVPAKGVSVTGKGNYWTIPTGKDARVEVRPWAGVSGVPGTVIYAGGESLAGQVLTVSIDGEHRIRRALCSRRGRLPLPDLPHGQHRVRMDVPKAARLFVSWPVEGATVYRVVGVYATDSERPVQVPLVKGARPRSLGVQVFSEAPPAEGAALYATVDRGERIPRSGVASAGRTILRRVLPVSGAPMASAIFLNRQSKHIWASDPIFIPLQDDLRAGKHNIAVAVHGSRAPTFVRFFSYSPVHQRERIAHLARLRTDEAQ